MNILDFKEKVLETIELFEKYPQWSFTATEINKLHSILTEPISIESEARGFGVTMGKGRMSKLVKEEDKEDEPDRNRIPNETDFKIRFENWFVDFVMDNLEVT